MRVLVVADVVGGVRTFVRELARELSSRDVDVHLALIGTKRHGKAMRDLGSSCEVRDLRLEWMDEPWADVQATGEWVEQLRERHRPDVIHMNTFAPVHSAEVPVLLTVHSCVLTWWRAVLGCDAPAAWRRYRSLALTALERADFVVAPSRALLEALTDVYGRQPRARVIPNAIAPIDARRPAVQREQLVVSVGRLWDKAKNVALLTRAAPAIDGQVVLIGSGVTGARGGARCVGELEHSDVTSWLRRAAVFAEPARYEPFGLAALEAALCGCALVLGDIPSLREVWGAAATFVSPDDPDQLAHAVNSLLHDPAQRARAATAAMDSARRRSPGAMATGYLAAYCQLAETAVPA